MYWYSSIVHLLLKPFTHYQSLQAWQAEGIPVATIDKVEELDPEKQLTKSEEEEDKSW